MLLLRQCEVDLASLRSDRPKASSTDRIDRGIPVFPPGKSQNTYHFVRPQQPTPLQRVGISALSAGPHADLRRTVVRRYGPNCSSVQNEK